MKARLGALEAEIATHNDTIQSLRAEVSAANERLARQATHYRDELRRLGAGTLPASPEPRAATGTDAAGQRPSLAERMGAPRPVADKPIASGSGQDARTAGYLRALSGRGSTDRGDTVVTLAGLASAAEASSAEAAKSGPQRSATSDETAGTGKEPVKPRRSGLLDRISSVSKSSS